MRANRVSRWRPCFRARIGCPSVSPSEARAVPPPDVLPHVSESQLFLNPQWWDVGASLLKCEHSGS